MNSFSIFPAVSPRILYDKPKKTPPVNTVMFMIANIEGFAYAYHVRYGKYHMEEITTPRPAIIIPARYGIEATGRIFAMVIPKT